jgi:hypothetical protein
MGKSPLGRPRVAYTLRLYNCEAHLPRCTVGGGQAEHESQGVDGRGRYGNEGGSSLGGKRRTDEEDKRAVSPRELIRRCQGLAEG